MRQSGARQIELLPRQAARVLGVAEEMCLRLQAGLTSFSREEKVRVIHLLRSQTPDLVWVHAWVAGARQASAFLRASPQGAARAAPLWALQGAVCPVPRSAPAEGPALWAQSG